VVGRGDPAQPGRRRVVALAAGDDPDVDTEPLAELDGDRGAFLAGRLDGDPDDALLAGCGEEPADLRDREAGDGGDLGLAQVALVVELGDQPHHLSVGQGSGSAHVRLPRVAAPKLDTRQSRTVQQRGRCLQTLAASICSPCARSAGVVEEADAGVPDRRRRTW
jgi:hypothetical protein